LSQYWPKKNKVSNTKVTLLYPPEQTWPDTMCKPNGSLAYPMLGAALIEADIEVEVYDACVGNSEDDLQETFYEPVELPTGMLRTGVLDDRILKQIFDSQVVGITSIFSHQETMVLNTIRLIKKNYPEKLVITGGVNARHRIPQFFDAGADVICTSEAEKTIVDIVRTFETGSKNFGNIPYVIFKKKDKIIFSKAPGEIIWDLDELPLPAWHLLPNERYWEIGRPHGGHFKDDEELRYISMMTSLGCPFTCTFCHIAGELKGSLSGEIGRFRIKSDERVIEELNILKDMNVKQIFIEDDSLLGKKKRAIRLIKKMIGMGFEILDVNGVNVVHLLKDGKPDKEVLEVLMEAGFRDIVLPFESANKRMISKYASNKWDVTNSDVAGLIKTCKDYGLRVAGNFMLGYPDETKQEVLNTVQYARERMEDGLDASNFFLVMPLPGTPMFDDVIRDGKLPKDFNPDRMHWQKANMINTPVPPKELEKIRDEAWQELNKPEFTNYKKDMVVDKNTGEVHTRSTK